MGWLVSIHSGEKLNFKVIILLVIHRSMQHPAIFCVVVRARYGANLFSNMIEQINPN